LTAGAVAASFLLSLQPAKTNAEDKPRNSNRPGARPLAATTGAEW